MNDSFTEEEMDELEELQNQQAWDHIMQMPRDDWYSQLDRDHSAVEGFLDNAEFLLLSKQEKWWERWWRKTKEEAYRWI